MELRMKGRLGIKACGRWKLSQGEHRDARVTEGRSEGEIHVRMMGMMDGGRRTREQKRNLGENISTRDKRNADMAFLLLFLLRPQCRGQGYLLGRLRQRPTRCLLA